jgi:hypothetical protein
MGFASRIAVTVGAVALLGGGQSAWAQPMASVTPNNLAGRLRTEGIAPAIGFQMSRPVNCMPGSGPDGAAYHCVAAMTDSARGGRTAALELMIFNGGYDFAARDAQVKAAVARMGGRWSLADQPEIGVNGGGRKISLKASCHQSRGSVNGPAFCLLPAAINVLIFSQVVPAQASSNQITTSQSGGSDSFDDMGRAASLASMGAIAVAKAQQG